MAFDIDQYLLKAFIHQLSGYEWFFYIITQLGSSLALILLATAAFLLCKGKVRIFAAVLIVGLLFGVVAMEDMKDLVKRPRPEGANSMIFLIKNDYSFPSGHALAIFLAATVLGAYFGWKFYAAGYTMALAVSLSRLYLGVHYPSDILAGAVIGIALGELLVYAAYRLGLAGNIGLISFIRKKAQAVPIKYKTNFLDEHWLLPAIGSFAAVSYIVFYYLDFAALSILAPAVAMMLVTLYIASLKLPMNGSFLIAFIFISIGFITALATFYLGTYALSLLAIAITYVAIIALMHINDKMIKTV